MPSVPDQADGTGEDLMDRRQPSGVSDSWRYADPPRTSSRTDDEDRTSRVIADELDDILLDISADVAAAARTSPIDAALRTLV